MTGAPGRTSCVGAIPASVTASFSARQRAGVTGPIAPASTAGSTIVQRVSLTEGGDVGAVARIRSFGLGRNERAGKRAYWRCCEHQAAGARQQPAARGEAAIGDDSEGLGERSIGIMQAKCGTLRHVVMVVMVVSV